MLVFPPKGAPIQTGTVLDLSKVRAEPFGEPLNIVRMHAPNRVGVSLEILAGKGLLGSLNDIERKTP